MAFTTKRGRPKKLKVISGNKPEIDLGTLELQQKRQNNMTAEPIDICRNKGIIDEAQHASALHFRWLYTLRFGAAGVSAMDLSNVKGREIRDFDEGWQREREHEYSLAIEALRRVGSLKVVMNVVIFNHRPRFLTGLNNQDPAQIKLNSFEFAKFSDGLMALGNLNPKKLQQTVSGLIK